MLWASKFRLPKMLCLCHISILPTRNTQNFTPRGGQNVLIAEHTFSDPLSNSSNSDFTSVSVSDNHWSIVFNPLAIITAAVLVAVAT